MRHAGVLWRVLGSQCPPWRVLARFCPRGATAVFWLLPADAISFLLWLPLEVRLPRHHAQDPLQGELLGFGAGQAATILRDRGALLAGFQEGQEGLAMRLDCLTPGRR